MWAHACTRVSAFSSLHMLVSVPGPASRQSGGPRAVGPCAPVSPAGAALPNASLYSDFCAPAGTTPPTPRSLQTLVLLPQLPGSDQAGQRVQAHFPRPHFFPLSPSSPTVTLTSLRRGGGRPRPLSQPGSPTAPQGWAAGPKGSHHDATVPSRLVTSHETFRVFMYPGRSPPAAGFNDGQGAEPGRACKRHPGGHSMTTAC